MSYQAPSISRDNRGYAGKRTLIADLRNGKPHAGRQGEETLKKGVPRGERDILYTTPTVYANV